MNESTWRHRVEALRLVEQQLHSRERKCVIRESALTRAVEEGVNPKNEYAILEILDKALAHEKYKKELEILSGQKQQGSSGEGGGNSNNNNTPAVDMLDQLAEVAAEIDSMRRTALLDSEDVSLERHRLKIWSEQLHAAFASLNARSVELQLEAKRLSGLPQATIRLSQHPNSGIPSSSSQQQQQNQNPTTSASAFSSGTFGPHLSSRDPSASSFAGASSSPSPFASTKNLKNPSVSNNTSKNQFEPNQQAINQEHLEMLQRKEAALTERERHVTELFKYVLEQRSFVEKQLELIGERVQLLGSTAEKLAPPPLPTSAASAAGGYQQQPPYFTSPQQHQQQQHPLLAQPQEVHPDDLQDALDYEDM